MYAIGFGLTGASCGLLATFAFEVRLKTQTKSNTDRVDVALITSNELERARRKDAAALC